MDEIEDEGIEKLSFLILMPSAAEAEFLKVILATNGIEVVLRKAGAFGSDSSEVEVYVLVKDFEKAKAIVGEDEKSG